MKIFFLSLVFASSLFAKTVTPEVLQKVDAAVKDFAQRQKGGGVAVAVIYGEGLDGYQQKNFMYGHAKGPQSAPPKDDNVFYLGSVTKVLTATLLAKFVAEGKVKLDDPAQKYVPKGVHVPTYDGKQMTLRDLATHTSALPNEAGGVTHPYHYTREEFYHWLSNYKLKYAPGTKSVYSNVGYGFLGLILATVANTTYEELVIREVCDPLGMDDTRTFDTFSESQKERLCDFYGPNGKPVKAGCCIALPALGGGGVFASTLHDMSLFLAFNMGLSNKMNDLLPILQNSSFGLGGNNNYIGLGWYNIPLSRGSQLRMFDKDGEMPGVSTYVCFVRETKTGVVVLTNSSSQSAPDLGNQVLRILNGE